MTTPLHVVLGAGQIGPRVAALLHAQGHRVRIVRRGAFAGLPAGIETHQADVGDPAAAIAATAGAAVVYHTVNPPYPQWATELPRLTTSILGAAAKASARLVVLDNLYMYGDTRQMNEDTPVAPTTKKGELRARAAAQLLDAHKAGAVKVVIGRASDFIGPDAVSAHFGERFYQRVFAGKAGECLGDVDSPHTYSYVADVAAGLVTLGLDPRGDGHAWMLPAPATESTRAVVTRMAAALGRPFEVRRVPGWALATMGVFSKMMKELGEMTYQWTQPFVLDDRRFRATFGATATGWDEIMRATMAWATGRYRVAKAA